MEVLEIAWICINEGTQTAYAASGTARTKLQLYPVNMGFTDCMTRERTPNRKDDPLKCTVTERPLEECSPARNETKDEKEKERE